MRLKYRRLSGALASIASLAAIAPTLANAETYVITYKGHLSSGLDQTGEFVSPNADLTGQAFTAVYTLTIPTPGSGHYKDKSKSYIYGGTAYGSTSPLSGKLTINGRTLAIDGKDYGQVYQSNSGSGSNDRIYHDVRDYFFSGSNYKYDVMYNYIFSDVNDIVKSSDYTKSLNYTVKSGDNYRYGYFEIYSHNEKSGAMRYAYGGFTTESVTIERSSAAAASAAPIPDQDLPKAGMEAGQQSPGTSATQPPLSPIPRR